MSDDSILCSALRDGERNPALLPTAPPFAHAPTQAAALLEEGVAAYRRVLEGGQPRVDALVCAGNALRWVGPFGPESGAQGPCL